MKKLLATTVLLAGALTCSNLQAAGKQDKLDTAKKELTPEMKTGKKVSFKSSWSAAQKEAKEKGLLVLVVFTDTKYCPACKQLDKDIFSKADFKDNAGAYCVVLEYKDVNTRNKGDKEVAEMRNKFNCKGLPGVCLVDAEGSVVATLGYGSNPYYMLEYLKRGFDKQKK